jgi:hypothetical protein
VRKAADDNMAHAHCLLDILGNTHSEGVLINDFQLQQ